MSDEHTNGHPPNLGVLLEGLASKARRLQSRLAGLNHRPSDLDAESLGRVAALAVEVSRSSREELRDNLVSIYPMTIRPKIDDDDVSHSLLVLDSIVNDIRDLIVAADSAAELAGFPITDQALLMPRPVLVPASEIRLEVRDIATKVASIEGDIASLKVIGNQVGLINVTISKLYIKVDIAKTILAIRDLIDASGLSRVLNGIRRIAEAGVRHLRGRISAVENKVRQIFGSIEKSADAAFSTAQGVLARARDETVFSDDFSGKIWSEGEIRALLLEGKPVPPDAARYVRFMNFGYSEEVNISEIAKLTELRELRICVINGIDSSCLGRLSKLENLDLDYVPGGVDFAFLTKLEALKILRISGTYTSTPRTLSMPENLSLPSLERLEIDSFETVKLSEFENTRPSSVRIHAVRNVNWNALKDLSRAEKLDLSGCRSVDLGVLAGFDLLEELDLRNTSCGDLRPLRTLQALRVIHMSRRLVSSLDLSIIPRRVTVLGDHGGVIRRGR